MFKLALIGKRLDYSYSKIIHEKYFNCSYDLVEIKDEEELENFFNNFKYDGINVTNPYKEKVIKYLDSLDIVALKTNSVNTIINKNGKLIGYNTDYYGFEYLISKNNIDIKNKNIYILGSGGVSKTLKYYFENKECNITIVSREKKENTINYEKLRNKDINILINATPVGVKPNIFDINKIIEEILINNDDIITIDLNYNPNISYFNFLSNTHYNGLEMLIVQAKKANELITNKIYDIDIDKIKYDLIKYNNVFFIGMSGAGKTYNAIKYANINNLKFIDIDEEIERRENKTIAEIFKDNGEEYFRNIEENVTIEYALKSGYCVATGGGIVLNKKAMYAIKAYSKVIFIDTDIDDIIKNIEKDGLDKRPLIRNKKDIIRLYNSRILLYKKYADEIVEKV